MTTLESSTKPLRRKVIVPKSGWQWIDLSELIRYHELLYFLAWRDVRLRYKQTVLGASWAVIHPLVTMVVFSIFFGRLAGLSKSVDYNYSMFVYAALLPWTLFSAVATKAGNSLLQNSHLVSRVYFPRLYIPLSSAGCGLVDFCLSFCVLLCLMFAYDVPLTLKMGLTPLFIAGTLVSGLAVGIFLSALIVSYRDFVHVMHFLIQIWLFASPVAYPLTVVPPEWHSLYAVNPMVGMICGFRASIMNEPVPWNLVFISMSSSMVLLVAGVAVFRRVERRFADVI